MKRETEQDPAPLPDPATLARLAADTRLSPDAALKQLQEAEATLARAEQAQRKREEARRRREAVPQPPRCPATLNDFYRLVVRAKDKTDSQPRFKRFLRYQIETEQQKIRGDLEKWKGHLSEQQGRIGRLTEPGDRPVARDSYPGTLTLEQAVQFNEEYIAQQGRRLLAPEDMDKELERRFAHYRAAGFEQPTWNRIALGYRHWWADKRRADRIAAGRARASKARKKVTDLAANAGLAAAICRPTEADSAAKAKKTVARLRKAHPAS